MRFITPQNPRISAIFAVFSGGALCFLAPDGRKGRVWLGVGAQCFNGKWIDGNERIVGDDRHCRLGIAKAAEVDDVARAEELRRKRREWPMDLMGGGNCVAHHDLREAILVGEIGLKAQEPVPGNYPSNTTKTVFLNFPPASIG